MAPTGVQAIARVQQIFTSNPFGSTLYLCQATHLLHFPHTRATDIGGGGAAGLTVPASGSQLLPETHDKS
jgi:hypothetical protein